jgi:predicted porin
MKKSLLALAVLGAFAGGALAQSSVTIYGVIDANLGKDLGSESKRMAQGASSRLGFRGVEDLGGGLAAFFLLDNRYTPFNGRINGGNTHNGSAVTFWQGRSHVGIRGSFGSVSLGREYDGSFFHSELVFDPWGWDTVVSTLTVAANSGGAGQSPGGPNSAANGNNFNLNRSVTYISPNFAGFSFTGQIAETQDNCNSVGAAPAAGQLDTRLPSTCSERPKSFGASYNAGPLRVGVGHANAGNLNDKWTSFGASYDLKVVKLWAQGGSGTNVLNQDVKGYQVSVTAPIGQTELRAALISQKINDVKTISGLGLGAHYALSPRTVLYADYARNSKLGLVAATTLVNEKAAYDAGVKHSF